MLLRLPRINVSWIVSVILLSVSSYIEANENSLILACSPIGRSHAYAPGDHSFDSKWEHRTELDRSRKRPMLVDITQDKIMINNSTQNPFKQTQVRNKDFGLFAQGVREIDLLFDGDKEPFGSHYEIIYFIREKDAIWAYRHEAGWFPTANALLLIYECVDG